MKKPAEGIIEAPSNWNEIQEIEPAELAKKEGKAKPKAMRTKRAIESDTADNDRNTPGTRERPKRRTAAKTPLRSPPRNVPSHSGTDPDETETEEDLEQKMKAYGKRKREQAATKKKSPIADAGEGEQSTERPKKKTKKLAARNAAAEENGLNDEPPRDLPSGGSFKRVAAATKRKAPIADGGESQQSAEPPKKKIKRSSARHAASNRDGPHDELLQDMPIGGRPKKAAVAAKKAAKVPKPQAKPEVGTRRSARIIDNPVVSSCGAEDGFKRRSLKTRFQRRAKTPEMPKNNIGLDENEIFSPRFPTEKPKPAKVTKKKRNGDRSSTNGKKIGEKSEREGLTP